jgi:DNA-binding NarL/FixJ family response regulator
LDSDQHAYRIMLVENDGSTIHSVKWVIDEDSQFVFLGYVTSKTQVAEFLDAQMPDVALVDVGLMRPGGGLLPRQDIHCLEEGLEVIALIKQISPFTRVIGFSNYFVDNPQLVKQALSRGADALIAKQSGPSDWNAWGEWLRYQIRGVIGGWWQMSPDVARLIEEEEQSRRASLPNDLLPLTERQMEILHLLASDHSDNEIANELHIVRGAVRGHISNIKERLHLRFRWQVIHEARRHGLGKQE